MREVLYSLPGIGLTVICWGMYGSVLHKGQHYLAGNRLKPLICVGIAYFFVAIIVPVLILAASGKLRGDWSFSGVSWSLAAGLAGALGALGIILALTAGGKPIYVMPLVFGGAPVVNVFVSMYFAGISWRELSPLFLAGMILVAVGAVTVLVFQPRPPTKNPAAEKIVQEHAMRPAAGDSSVTDQGPKSRT
jgi:hypothetical protein